MAPSSASAQTPSRRISRRRLLFTGAWATAATVLAGAGLGRDPLGLARDRRDSQGSVVIEHEAAPAERAPLSVAYVRGSDTLATAIAAADGERTRADLVPLEALRSGDARLQGGARVEIHGFSAGPNNDWSGLRSIALDVESPSGLPHHAWRLDNAAVPAVGSPTSFFAPMGDAGLRLRLHVEPAVGAARSLPVTLRTDGTTAAARRGTYVVAFPASDAAPPRWRRCTFDCVTHRAVPHAQIVDRRRPLDAPYLLISLDVAEGAGPAL